MYKICLYCVGNLKDKEYISLCDEYIKRISKFAEIEVKEIKEKNNLENVDLIVEKESENILELVDNFYLFDIGGEEKSSEEFSKDLEKYFLNNSRLNLVIGGSYGTSQKLKNRAIKRISFSKMTFNHRLFRVMALEQIYRAFSILNNTSYHK